VNESWVDPKRHDSPPKQGIVGLLHPGTLILAICFPSGLKPTILSSLHLATQMFPTPSRHRPSNTP
jgi:hypothetical protein